MDSIPVNLQANLEDGAEPSGAERVRIAVVAGATGLVGAELCRQLKDDPGFEQVIMLARRPPPVADPPLQAAVVDFARIDEWTPELPLDTVFCALGTTIAKAGSEEAFRAVDFDLVVAMARLAQRGRARHFVLVSSLGADPESRVFYLRVKGEAEQAVRDLGLPHVAVLRPSVLEGERAERRPGERAASVAGRILRPLLIGPLAKYRPTPAVQVAEAMRYVARPGREGFEVLGPVDIMRWRERAGLLA